MISTESSFKTGYLKSKDQVSLFYRHYPVADKKALVLLLHGFGEHSGRYNHVIDRLHQESYEVFSFDFRGHGQSKGERGDVECFSRYEEDVFAAFAHIEENILCENKLFLVAHSMGALVGLHAIARARLKLNGLVFSSPLFGLKMPVPEWKKLASFVAASIVPKMRLSTNIRGELLSSDSHFAQAYDNDPLVLKNVSVRAFREIYFGYQNARELAHTFSSSLFMQVAGDDLVVDSRCAEEWYNHLDKKRIDASIKVYPGFLHEIYNETQRIKPIDDLVCWLNERL